MTINLDRLAQMYSLRKKMVLQKENAINDVINLIQAMRERDETIRDLVEALKFYAVYYDTQPKAKSVLEKWGLK